jgi:hypothetical protein
MRTDGGSSFVVAAAVCIWTIATAITASAFVPPSTFSITYARRVARAALSTPTARWHRRNATVVDDAVAPLHHRFERTASRIRHVDQPCIITIDGVRYNVTAWGTDVCFELFVADCLMVASLPLLIHRVLRFNCNNAQPELIPAAKQYCKSFTTRMLLWPLTRPITRTLPWQCSETLPLKIWIQRWTWLHLMLQR